MDWQIIPDYFKIGIHCDKDSINWDEKEITILEHNEFIQIVLTHYTNFTSGTSGTSDSKPQPNNTFTIHNIKHLTFADIKKHWLNNINNNFLFVKCFTIDEDYFIAPLYIYSNRVHLGVFVLDNEIGNELANEIIIRILNADDFSVKYPVYTFMSQIQNNNKSITSYTEKIKKIKEKHKQYFKSDDARDASNASNLSNAIKEIKNINIFNGIIEYSKPIKTFWKDKYLMTNTKKILWQHIFYNIRNYLPKLNCKIKVQN